MILASIARSLADAAPSTDAWRELVREGPFVLFASFILFAGYKKWWRFGHEYDDKVTDFRAQLAAKDAEIAALKASRESDLAALRRECDDDLDRIVRDKDAELVRIQARADKYEGYVAETVSKTKEVVQIVTAFAAQQQQRGLPS